MKCIYIYIIINSSNSGTAEASLKFINNNQFITFTPENPVIQEHSSQTVYIYIYII